MAIKFNTTDATLVNLVDIFHKVAKGHAMINSLGIGASYDIGANTIENYPLLWIIPLPSQINESWIDYKFQFIMMDLVEADTSNEIEVQSNCIQTLSDVLYILRDYYGLDIVFANQVTPFSEKYADRVSGWYMECTISIPKSYGACDAPFEPCGQN